MALLRGVNLGSRNRIAMADLRALVGEVGEDVQTYVQSGNVVFRSKAKAAALAKAIEKSIKDALGLDVTVLLRTRRRLTDVMRRNPFDTAGVDPTKLHVTFLAETPSRDRVRSLSAQRFEPDEFDVVRREVYLLCPKGYGRSKLSNMFFERQLAVAGTTRNWRTVTKLAELANG